MALKMAWSALIRVWDGDRRAYRRLTLRIEDAPEPSCLVRLYEGETAIGEESAATPREAMTKAVELARRYLNNPSISEDSLDWVQL